MASVTLNNQSSASSLLLFTDVPNILLVSDTTSGTKSTITLTVNNSWQSSVTADTQYYITILDETITNVMNPMLARNKQFYIASNAASTAASIARALRSCGSLAADWDIIQSSTQVLLRAKTVGSRLNVAEVVTTNISTANLSRTYSNGSASSPMWQSRVNVDVSGDTYVTTLEKMWYNGEAAFDVSPILTTIADYGTANTFTLGLSYVNASGTYASLGNISSNYITYGYIANDSSRYLNVSTPQFLINTNLPMKRYTFGNVIDLSVASLSSSNSVYWEAKDSALNTIVSGSEVFSGGVIKSGQITVPMAQFLDSYYIDVTIGSTTIRFDVIKPLKMTETNTRIYYYNQYGGIGFLDMSGAESYSIGTSIETYEKNVYDYYKSTDYEKERIYKDDVSNTWTLTSHLMSKEGIYIANEVARSKKQWIIYNGRKRYVIPTSIDVTENDTYNNVYTIRYSFRFSSDK